MARLSKQPLSRGEIAGYLTFVAGLIVIASRNLLTEYWIPVGIAIMAIGLFVAYRSSTPSA